MEETANKKHTVLVVDDSESEIDILVECLSDFYEVGVAMDGPSALESIQEDPPDIILLDIMMPGMDGYEVCRKIKQSKNTKDVLVIFVTGLSDAVDETRGFELGAVDYITKPFSFSVVRARVKTHIELAVARRKLLHQNILLKENIELREQVEQITRHDLKNPLTVILNVAQMLSSEFSMDPEDKDEMLEDQIKSCYMILDMINRSLDLYKMEKGVYKLDTKQVDILILLDRILLGMNKIIQSDDIKVEIMINDNSRNQNDQFNIQCDELLFYSMMSNLIKNAIEASSKGTSVLISLIKNKCITIHIQNQKAVPIEIRNRFFEKMVTFGKFGGTGLGTYSARLMAEMHSGKIALSTSDEEDKTIVTISLPEHL